MERGEAQQTPVRWRTPRLPRQIQQGLTQRSTVRATTDLILRLAIQLALLGGTWIAARDGAWLAAVGLLLGNGGLWFFMGWAGIGHELFHGTVFRSRKLNRFLFRTFSVLSWSNFGYFEYSHWRHHRLTLFSGDPELPPTEPLRLRDLPWLLTIDIFGFLRRLRILFLNALGVVPLPQRITDRPTAREERTIKNGARVVLVSQLLLALACVVTGQLWLLLAICLAPFTFTILGRILESAQHFGLEHEVDDFRRNTRTLVIARPLSFAYANMNYHLEHHLYPSIPYYNLPLVRESGVLEAGYLPAPTVGVWPATLIAFGRESRADRHI